MYISEKNIYLSALIELTITLALKTFKDFKREFLRPENSCKNRQQRRC
jgi:hypothetical protein